MVKRLISAVLVAVSLPLGTAFAADGAKTNFTAREAVDYMISNSLELKAQEENIKYCELKQLADSGMRKRLNKMEASGGINDINTMLAAGGYVEYSDGVQTEIAKRSCAETKYKLGMQTENKFYSCLNADRKIGVAAEALANAKENERIAAARAEAGVISSLEAESFSLAVIAAQNAYDDSVRSRDYAYSELKRLMSYPNDAQITLSGSFERQPMDSTPLKTALDGLDLTANKLNLDAGLDLQARLLDEYRSLYTSSMVDYRAQTYAYAKAEAEYNDNVTNLRLAVENAYDTMASTYGKLDYIDKAIELKEKQADAKKTAYELGLSTASEYISAVQELDSLKLDLVDAEIGAYLTSKAYEMLYHKAE